MTLINPFVSFPSGGGGGGWTPADLTNLLGWYDASDSGSFTFSSGVLVSQWNDLSGNANHMTSPAGREPSRTGTQNGLTIVEFAPGAGNSDNGDYLILPNVFSALAQTTVYLVIKTRFDPPSDSNNTGLMHFYQDGGNLNGTFPFTDGIVYSGIGSSARKDTGNPATALNQFNTVAFSSASSSWNMRINGTSHFSTATNTVAINTDPKFGYQIHSNHFKFDGYLAEMAITEAAYDSQFESYAQSKWATP